MEEKETELRCRALIGDLLNLSSDCLENLRPRAQYMHSFRTHYSRVKDLLRVGYWDNTLNRGYKALLKEIIKIYNEVGRPTKDNSMILSEKQLILLENNGYQRTRNIGNQEGDN